MPIRPASFLHWINSMSSRTFYLSLLLGSLVVVNIYFLYTIILPWFSNRNGKVTPIVPPPPSLPKPYHPPYYGVPKQRIPPSRRKFKSQVIDDYIILKSKTMQDQDLATLLNNCLPNTLDTTIEWYDLKYPHTFLITGDIPAMWIRDSTNQILPYLPFINEDLQLQSLILGVIETQADYLTYDPYANAFLRPWYATIDDKKNPAHGRVQDRVIPQYDSQYVWESKYELDSLGHFFELGNEYMTATGDTERVLGSKTWLQAVHRVLQVIHDQQRGTWEEEERFPRARVYKKPPFPIYENSSSSSSSSSFSQEEPMPLPLDKGYRFTRYSDRPTETLGANGLGGISQRCGLVKSAFRPSDDATTFPYLIPANAQISVQLKRLAQIIRTALISNKVDHHRKQLSDIAVEAQSLGDRIHQAIYAHAVVDHPVHGKIFAYEVDCYGSFILMDDANTPSLLSLPLLGFMERTDPLYLRTRSFLLSSSNPWYFKGKFGQGIGGPHTGYGMIWPISLLVQSQTSTDEDEIKIILDTLKRLASQSTHGWMVESFHKDNPKLFTRPWFSWANGLLGTTIADLDARFPHLL
ncbi:DUF1237 domain-containing protein [Halteromyces radiatus]|uniref:DUF1237 domain-containing protein n=1 Tax=Halteromyces radiatus TaxID=101107 RepID=UPI00222006A0|nr:DUF1237 domain-containing protein [Halteromyces radiatus]KAI8093712.1 DUF1237 domain-containing protein [Halteromyces radiatus]